MKRIILIGNGFDIAHGMKTKYKDFLDNIWQDIYKEAKVCTPGSAYEHDFINIIKTPHEWFGYDNYSDFSTSLSRINQAIQFKNKFFQIISESNQVKSWVDIETEYYEQLKKSYKKERGSIRIDQLNSEFEMMTSYLSKYLTSVETSFKGNRIQNNIDRVHNIIYSDFAINDFCEESINSKVEIEFEKINKDLEALKSENITIQELNTEKRKLISMLGHDKTKDKLRKVLLSKNAPSYFNLLPDEILFLNFNYTSTEDIYKESLYSNIRSIHIHGSLLPKDKNPVIFGFGDELDDEYKSIEKLNDNEYLENIKSIKYFETDNYKELLEYVNSGAYQIFIFGHSCGNSDRTLLNTLFEHKNCVSIKPYYYQISEEKDNYSDIIKNISRSFNNKAVMRDKVVNKKYCEPLVEL